MSAEPGGDLLGLAERALELADGEAQATVVRRRSLTVCRDESGAARAAADELQTVEFACVRDGHVATARSSGSDDEALPAAARQAALAADAATRLGSGDYPGLPTPIGPVRPHAGWDAGTAALDAAAAAHALNGAAEAADERGARLAGVWSVVETRTAIASTAGIAAGDAVTKATLRVTCTRDDGASGQAARSAVAAAALDAAAAADEAALRIPEGDPVDLEPGELPVVLTPEALGALLDVLGRHAFNGLRLAEGSSPLAGRLGERVAPATVSLADSPQLAGTLQRGLDAEGLPKATLALIEEGIARAVVHDTRSAAIARNGASSTFHAVRPGGHPAGPAPRNLVLAGGEARDIAELAGEVGRGLLVTRLDRPRPLEPGGASLAACATGASLIEDGRVTRPLAGLTLAIAPLEVLAATEALTARPRLTGAGVVCPSLRASSGVRVAGPAR